MIIVVGKWESGWMNARQETYMWRDCKGLGIDKIIMIPKREDAPNSVEQYDTLQEAFEQYPNMKKVFVEAYDHEQTQDLYSYKHPEDVIYIFGNNQEGHREYITKEDDVINFQLNEREHKESLPWAITSLGIVLYDRRFKEWQSQ